MTPSLTFHDHVQELRRRLAWLVLTIGGGAVTGYVFRAPIVRFLQHPLGEPLFYTSPAGSFNFILKVSTTVGIVAALPLIVYHLIRFLEPALPVPIKRSLVIKVIASSTILALLGLAFGFFIMIPMSLHFFSTYSSATIKPLISVDEYLSFVLGLLATFAAVFQIPLVVLFINRIKPIPPKRMLRYQRHIVVGAFVIAVILPFTYDPVSQFVMAVPIVFLYYLSIILVWVANRHVTYAVTEPATTAAAVVTDQSQPAFVSEEPSAHEQHVEAWRAPSANLLKLNPIAERPVNPDNLLRLHQPAPAPMNPANLLKLNPPSAETVHPNNILALEHFEPGPVVPPHPQNLLRLDQPAPPPINSYNLLDLSNQA